MLPGMQAPSTKARAYVAAPVTGPLQPPVKREVRGIVVHCAASPSGKWLGGHAPGQAGYVTAPTLIDRMHAARGFHRDEAARGLFNWHLPHIGYHYVVDLDGTVWTGRALAEVGAHAAGHNSDSVGVCLVGGAEAVARYTLPQWESLAALVRELCGLLSVPLRVGGMVPGHGVLGGVMGHRDLSPDANGDGRITRTDWLKTCPGFDVGDWLRSGLQAMRPSQVTNIERQA